MKNFIPILIDHLKRLKKRYIIIIITIIIPIIMLFVPVKFAVKPDDIDKDKEYYILKYIYGDTTDSGWYIVDSWDNQLTSTYTHLNGKVPIDYLSPSIYNEYDNRYVVYGSLKTDTRVSVMGNKYDYYTLTIDNWDIISDIKGGRHEKYLTIYDLNWFPWFSEEPEKWRADSINE